MASDTLTSVAPVHRFILLTDIAQSSRLAEQYPGQYESALGRHNQLVEQVVAERGGEVYKQTGDGYLVLFETAGASLDAALALGEVLGQLELLAEDEPLLVRLALHAGELKPSGPEYFGPALNRVSRICQVCNPGQVLLSGAVASTVGKLADDARLQDLGQHHLRDLAEPERLYQLDSARFSRHEFPPLSTLDNRPNNLVEQPNAFIGRESELNELAELLLDGKRLVSIAAPGGYGKSRLAAQLCANLLHRFDNGVFMAFLAPVRESLDVPIAIANALGFQFSGSREPEDQLCDYLRKKELLLCLDNFEHLLDSAPLVSQLLAAAPKLKVLVTSREPLRIQGEQTYVLEPLPVAASNGQFSEAELLFADRAALVNRGFALTPENSAEVGHFCGHMAGIPLAIELAAAWMDSFTLTELHDELTNQLELEARASDLEPRHQSLKASLDWSWSLLGEQQQEVLMRLSTFRGGFFSEAAGAVLNMKGMALRATLGRLSDKSWLYTREVDGQTRFYLRDMLALEYAFARLQQSQGSAESLFELAVGDHAAYYAALSEREGQRLKGGGTPDGGAAQLAALRTWQLELENISEAIDTALNRGNVDWLLPFARNLWRKYSIDGAYLRMRERYQQLVMAAEATGNSSLRLEALLGVGNAYDRLGQYADAEAALETAVALARNSADNRGEAYALTTLANVHYHQCNYPRAMEFASQSLLKHIENHDRHGKARTLTILAILNGVQGDETSAGKLHSRALAVFRGQGDAYGEGMCLGNLANVCFALGDYAESRKLQSQALQIRREVGYRQGEAYSLTSLAILCQLQGDYAMSAELEGQALQICRELGDHLGEASSLTNLAILSQMQGDLSRADELQSEALALSRQSGNRFVEASSLSCLADTCYLRGDLSRAAELHSQALGIRRENGERGGVAQSLRSLASIHLKRDDYRQSAELLRQALEIQHGIGNKGSIASVCATCAALFAALGHLHHAAVALSGAEQLAATIGMRLGSDVLTPLDETCSRLAAAVASGVTTAEQIAAWQAEGEALSPDELAEFVLAELAKLKDIRQKGKADQQAGT